MLSKESLQPLVLTNFAQCISFQLQGQLKEAEKKREIEREKAAKREQDLVGSTKPSQTHQVWTFATVLPHMVRCLASYHGPLSCNPICYICMGLDYGTASISIRYPIQTPNSTSIAVGQSMHVQTLRARRSRKTFKPGRKRCEHRISGGWTSWLRSRRLSRTGLLDVVGG